MNVPEFNVGQEVTVDTGFTAQELNTGVITEIRQCCFGSGDLVYHITGARIKTETSGRSILESKLYVSHENLD
jgi:hypothetical protein